MTREVSIREARGGLAEILRDATNNKTVIYVTNRGYRVAAVVPVEAGEQYHARQMEAYEAAQD